MDKSHNKPMGNGIMSPKDISSTPDLFGKHQN